MSIGLPAHLMASSCSQSFIRASHAIAGTCLTLALLTVLVFQIDQPELILWPAALALVPMLVLLVVNHRRNTRSVSVSYLIVGSAGTYWYAATFFSQLDPVYYGDVLSMSLLQVALVAVGGPGVGLAWGLGWSAAGLFAGVASTAAAGLQTGHGLGGDWAAAVVFTVSAAIMVFNALARRHQRLTPPRLHRAARDEHLANLRYRVELKAAALLHDTILSHLTAVAASTGALPPDLRTQMERDLEVLIGEEWLSQQPTGLDGGAGGWRDGDLLAAVQQGRLQGLEIDVTGDPACLRRLSPQNARALGLAVKQCLVNVIKHSGTNYAEVAVYSSSTDLSVMVVDTGRGFVPDEVAPDRFGLRTSIRRRIEEVGGSVKVFSTVGRGTSIMIRVPVASTAALETAVGRA
jgi:signal transduction histidine kinase